MTPNRLQRALISLQTQPQPNRIVPWCTLAYIASRNDPTKNIRIIIMAPRGRQRSFYTPLAAGPWKYSRLRSDPADELSDVGVPLWLNSHQLAPSRFWQ